jgi:hypothetical protein
VIQKKAVDVVMNTTMNMEVRVVGVVTNIIMNMEAKVVDVVTTTIAIKSWLAQ